LDKLSFDFTKDRLGNVSVPYEIWDISDISQSSLESAAEVLEIISIASETFKDIQKKVNRLIEEKHLLQTVQKINKY
jgi:hypothetical protein